MVTVNGLLLTGEGRASAVRAIRLACGMVAALFLFLAPHSVFAQTYPQPYIASFSPMNGPVGTTITVTGSGFTGATAAWIGSGHDAAFNVINDGSMTVTVPADATSGQVSVKNPQHQSWSGSSFALNGASYPQPYISSFSPSSGAIGSTITVTGSGFTGANAAWVGSGHDATFNVVNDGSITITVPADASSGQISVANPQHQSWSGSGFTLTSYPQPYIASWSPTSGPVGTVINVTGNGFTGATEAWVGNGHDAAFNVINDGSMTITVPADATTGQISVKNPEHQSWAGSAFTVSTTYPQPYIASWSPTSGSVGTVINVTGNGFTGATEAWVGNGHDAAFNVISDTSMTITVPADATTGQISVKNPQHQSWAGSAFTVSTGSQPTITSFSPTSGVAGSTITVTGTGFNGTTAAWVGNGYDAAFTVNSDTSITITVPDDATTGPIKIVTPSSSALSSASFTVIRVYPQPSITSFSPASGAVNTTITVTGTGFTGANAATVGGHSAAFSVVNDGSLTIVVPAGATSGKIGVSNPSFSALSSNDFTVNPSPALSVSVQGNHFVNGNGNTIQLRGVNVSSLQGTPIQGWSPDNPWGGQTGDPTPNWNTIKGWAVNVVRIPLNDQSWLNLTCTEARTSNTKDADPGNNYQQTVIQSVQDATAAGLYVILDLHWSAPGNICALEQGQMADADHSITFWSQIATTFKTYPNVMFELFNEPFFDQGFSDYGLGAKAWSHLMQGPNGTNGSFNSFAATGGIDQDGHQIVRHPFGGSWTVAGMQSMLNAIRSAGATNVVLVGALQYDQILDGWLANRPNDSAGQLAAVWHAYPSFGAAWNSTAYTLPNNGEQAYSTAQNILNNGIPVIVTEFGDHDAPNTDFAPFVGRLLPRLDAMGISYLGWTWNTWQNPDNVLIKNAAGDPTAGYGVCVHNHYLVRAGQGSTDCPAPPPPCDAPPDHPEYCPAFPDSTN